MLKNNNGNTNKFDFFIFFCLSWNNGNFIYVLLTYNYTYITTMVNLAFSGSLPSTWIDNNNNDNDNNNDDNNNNSDSNNKV